MEHEDIREVVEWWGRSAELSREGGFDGTEVHISHSYLLHQFLSPLYNKRTDEYGGSFENRLRFAREVIDEVRAPGRLRLGRRRPDQPQRLHPGRRSTSRMRPRRAGARARRADRLRQRHRRRLPQHLARDPALGRARRLPRRSDRAGEGGRVAAGLHGRRDQGRRARRGDPRRRQGGHGGDDPRPDRRPGVREQGAARAARTRSSTASAATRAASAASSRACRSPARSTRPPAARVGSAARSSPAEPPARWLVAGGGPAGMKAAATLAERGHEVIARRAGRPSSAAR